MPYTIEDIFGISSDQLQSADRNSPEAPATRYVAGPSPIATGNPTDHLNAWRSSPVFWLAAFAVFALGILHLEGRVSGELNLR